MERYESKTVAVDRPAADIFGRFDRLDALTPIASQRIEGWSADADTCSFRVQGFTVRLRVAERVAPTLVRLASDGGVPVDFGMALRLDPTGENSTLLRVEIDVEVNAMLKMMVGARLQQGADALCQMIAAYLNSLPA